MKIVGWRAWFVTLPKQSRIVQYNNSVTNFPKLPRDGCLGFRFYYDQLVEENRPYSLILLGNDWYFRAEGIAAISPLY